MKKERSFEYDAFGPWIYLIEGPHKVPPLFLDYEKYLDGAEMCLKIPREIERRNANPKMNLYDAVVAIFKSEIILLERKAQGRNEFAVMSRIAMSKIAAVKHKMSLLSGRLTLITPERAVEIPYNAVSEDLIRKAVHLIRSLMPAKKRSLGIKPMAYSMETMEQLFVHTLNRLLEEDGSFELAAYQPNISFTVPREFGWNFLNRFGLTEKVFSSFVILHNKTELLVIHRHFYPDRNSSEAYSYTYHYLPLEAIEKIFQDTAEDGTKGLRIQTAMVDLFLPGEEGNEGTAALTETIHTAVG